MSYKEVLCMQEFGQLTIEIFSFPNSFKFTVPYGLHYNKHFKWKLYGEESDSMRSHSEHLLRFLKILIDLVGG